MYEQKTDFRCFSVQIHYFKIAFQGFKTIKSRTVFAVLKNINCSVLINNDQ